MEFGYATGYDSLVETERGDVAVQESHIEIFPNPGYRGKPTWRDETPVSDLIRFFEKEIRTAISQSANEHRGRILESMDILNEINGIVYLIECGKPDSDELLKRRAKQVLGTNNVPSWVWAAFKQLNREYVGGTHRPDDRIREHVTGSEQFEGAKFTQIFEPISVKEIDICLSGNVYELEEEVAQYWESDSGYFVYQS